MTVQRLEIYKLLDERMNLEDLQNLCLHLDIDFENLAASNKQGKIRELMLYCQRREKIPRLLEYLEHWLQASTADTSFPSLRKIYQNLPSPSHFVFIGRQDELNKIRQLLLPSSNCRVVSIDGMGGCGKTSLALETAHYYLSSPKSDEAFYGIVWATASTSLLTAEGVVPNWRGINTLEDIYTVIALTLDRRDILRAARAEQDEMIAQVLMRQRTLLIIDNLETMDDKRVHAFLESLPTPTKAIVTTRLRFSSSHRIHLEPFTKESGVALIHSECNKRDVNLTDAETETLFVLTSGIPLAIVWSVAQIGSGFAVDTTLDMLKDARTEITEFCLGRAIESIRSTDAYDLLLSLALFAGDVSRDMLAGTAGLDREILRRDRALSRLFVLGLVEEDNQRLRILPLTKRYLGKELTQSLTFVTEARKRQAQAMTIFLTIYNPMQNTSPAFQPFWQELDNIRDLIRQAYSNQDLNALVNLTVGASPFFFVYGLWEELLQISTMGTKSATALQDWENEAWLNIHPALIYIERRDPELANQHVIAVELAMSKMDVVSGDLQEALGFRKAVLAVIQDDPKAKELLEHEVLLSQQIGSKWREAGNLYHLGRWAYGKELWAESEAYFQQALQIGESQKDYRSMALAYSYLPELVYRRGGYEDAYQLYQVAIEIAETYGEVLSQARLIFGMARLTSDLGRIEEALHYAEKAYDLYSHLAIRDALNDCEKLIDHLHQQYERLPKSEN